MSVWQRPLDKVKGKRLLYLCTWLISYQQANEIANQQKDKGAEPKSERFNATPLIEKLPAIAYVYLL